MEIKVASLRLGDTVRLFDGSYSHATVYKIDKEGNAFIQRPYIHTGDVIYIAGPGATSVISYIGLEDFTLLANTTVELVCRNNDKLK